MALWACKRVFPPRQLNQSDQLGTVDSQENSGGRQGGPYGLQQLLSDRDLINIGRGNDVEELEGSSLLQYSSLRDHDQNNELEASAAGINVIRLLNDQLEQYDQVNSGGTGRSLSRKGLSVEEKKIRKRQHDAKYRNNKRIEYEKLKEENKMLRNRLATQPGIGLINGKETTAAPCLNTDLLQDWVRELTVVYPHQVQDNIQGSFSVVPSDQSQTTLSVIVQSNDAGQTQSLEENRSGLNEHQLFMEKLGQDERSRVSYSDLEPLLQGETQDVIEGYRIPLVLLPIDEKIIASYSNITGNCLLSSFSSGNVLILFLATIKEMQDTLFEEVTEELLLRWRDNIAEAKRINFNVAFATEHLKKIANSYLARKACNELSSLDKRMEALEAEYNDLRKERLEKQEAYPPQLLAASQHFPATVGLFLI